MTLYEILEVSEKASDEVIEKAYKTLAKKYHPDLQQTPEDKKNAEQKMQKINEAYETLKDENKRIEYDRKLQIEKDKETEYYHYNNMQQNIKQQSVNNYNEEKTPKTNYYQNIDNYKSPAEWQQILSNLSPKEREKLMKKIQRDAREEYTKVAEDYYRQQGYVVRHKTTPREYLERFLTIVIIVCIFALLWIIPPSRNWMIGIYNDNEVIKLLIDLIIGIFKGFLDAIF